MVWLTVNSSQIWYRVVNNTRTRQMKYCLWLARPCLAWASSLHDHTQTLHIRRDSSGRVISPTQMHLPDSTQHSQDRDIHGPGGIRTRNPSNRAAADPPQTARPPGSALLIPTEPTEFNTSRLCIDAVERFFNLKLRFHRYSYLLEDHFTDILQGSFHPHASSVDMYCLKPCRNTNSRHFCYGAAGECLLAFPIPSMCALSRLFQAQCATR
jgi:hypothetical protein